MEKKRTKILFQLYWIVFTLLRQVSSPFRDTAWWTSAQFGFRIRNDRNRFYFNFYGEWPSPLLRYSRCPLAEFSGSKLVKILRNLLYQVVYALLRQVPVPFRDTDGIWEDTSTISTPNSNFETEMVPNQLYFSYIQLYGHFFHQRPVPISRYGVSFHVAKLSPPLASIRVMRVGNGSNNLYFNGTELDFHQT